MKINYKFSHIRNADGAFLVYDVTNENSYSTLDYWHESITKATDEDIVIFLIGNKYDLVRTDSSKRKIGIDRAIDFTKKYNLDAWAECSAKDDYNISESFVAFYKSL
jgi:GTPase SAR1 family protein